MITTQHTSNTKAGGFEQSVACRIDEANLLHIEKMLRNNYSDPMWATMREITANALDSSDNVPEKPKILIHLPEDGDSTFSVTDFGVGMSHEFMMEFYNGIGSSTKRRNNNEIGGFGIGKFAPLSYVDAFTVSCYDGKEERAYIVRITESGSTEVALMGRTPSTLRRGVKVSVAIPRGDHHRFRQRFDTSLERLHSRMIFFGPERPTEKTPPLLKGSGWDINSDRFSGRQIFCGGIPYGFNGSSLDDAARSASQALPNNVRLYIPIGEVDIAHSRENLEYTPRTQRRIQKALEVAHSELVAKITEQLQDKETYLKGLSFLKECRRDVVNLLDFKQFAWHGIRYDDHNRLDSHLPDSVVASRYMPGIENYEVSSSRCSAAKKARWHKEPSKEESIRAVIDHGDEGTLVIDDIITGVKSLHARLRKKFGNTTHKKSVTMVVADSPEFLYGLKAWAKEIGLPYSLLSDLEKPAPTPKGERSTTKAIKYLVNRNDGWYEPLVDQPDGVKHYVSLYSHDVREDPENIVEMAKLFGDDDMHIVGIRGKIPKYVTESEDWVHLPTLLPELQAEIKKATRVYEPYHTWKMDRSYYRQTINLYGREHPLLAPFADEPVIENFSEKKYLFLVKSAKWDYDITSPALTEAGKVLHEKYPAVGSLYGNTKINYILMLDRLEFLESKTRTPKPEYK